MEGLAQVGKPLSRRAWSWQQDQLERAIREAGKRTLASGPLRQQIFADPMRRRRWKRKHDYGLPV